MKWNTYWVLVVTLQNCKVTEKKFNMKINRLTLYLVKKERRMGMSSELEQNTRSNKKRSKRKSIKWFILIPFFLLILEE